MDLVYFEWWNGAVAAGINIILNYLWIPSYGYTGSAWATLISEVWLLSITFLFFSKAYGNIIDLSVMVSSVLSRLSLLELSVWSCGISMVSIG